MAILPDFGAAQFTPGQPIDNPYFPLTPGTIRSFQGLPPDAEPGDLPEERSDLFVTYETREILGVQTVVVRDTEYEEGLLTEDTLDWHAQDDAGNVWYLGEISYIYRYDEEGNYVSTDSDGSWEAGVDGALPGYLIQAEPGFGAAYYQEYDVGNAEDEAIVAETGVEVTTGLGTFTDVVKTIDYTALSPDDAEFKYYAPDVGQVLIEEGLDDAGEPELRVELTGLREIARDAEDEDDSDFPLVDDEGEDDGEDDDDAEFQLDRLVEKGALAGVEDADEPEPDDFVTDEGALYVTFVSETAGNDNAIGAYRFDASSGDMGEGTILFGSTSEAAAGGSVAVELGADEGLGVFLVPDVGEAPLDVAAFEDGGLQFKSILDEGTANLEDPLAPLVADAEGTYLPLHAFHALGNDDGFNFLNPAAGVQAVELETPLLDEDRLDFEVTLLGFDDLSVTDPRYDGDYNDVIVAVSERPLDAGTIAELNGALV